MAQAAMLTLLIEFDSRRLYAKEGYSSLFAYCVRELGHSEAAAYKRIQSARAAAKFPRLIEWVAEGRIHLSAIAVLAPHVRVHDAEALFVAACGKSKVELERMVAALAPRPDRRDVIRSEAEPPQEHLTSSRVVPEALPGPLEVAAQPLPGPPPPGPPPIIAPTRPDAVTPTSPGRVRFAFSGSEALRAKLGRVRDLAWHADPRAGLEGVVERLADFWLERKDPDRRLARRRERGARRGPPGGG